MNTRIIRPIASLITIMLIGSVFSDGLTSAESNFTVTVQFFRYSNPSSKIGSLPDKPCCNFDIACSDNNNCTTCTRDCNNYFIFCLKQPMILNPSELMCPYGRLQTGVLSGGDDIIFVSNNESLNSFKIPNPFMFDNLQQRNTLQLFVTTLDQRQDDTVEQFLIEILMRRDNSLIKTFGGRFGVATIHLSYRVSCSENYYGEHCDIFCEGRNDSSGHYSCDDEGNIVCLSGFVDPSTFCVCSTTLAECVPQGPDFEGRLPANVVAAAIIGTLIGMVLIVTLLITLLLLFWRKKGHNKKWTMFSSMCHESRTRNTPPTSDDDCNPHENPTYNEEAISIQEGTISTTRRSQINSHNYDYITGNRSSLHDVRHPNGVENGPYSYAEANQNTQSGPAPYSYAENNSSYKKGNAQATPYSYVDNTLIQDMVLKAVHEADAERLRTMQHLKEQSINVDIPQHYETMENYNVGNHT